MSDWMSELEKVHELKEKGILSEEEFLKEKERVLASRNTVNLEQTVATQDVPATTPASDNISRQGLKSLSHLNIQWLVLFLIAFGIVGFVASFFDWFSANGTTLRSVDTDQGVVQQLYFLLFSLIGLSLIFFSDNKETLSKRIIGFVLPMAIWQLPSIWLSLTILWITPAREDWDFGILYSGFEPAFWIILVSQTLMVVIPFWIGLRFLKHKFDSGSKLIRIGTLVMPAAFLGVLGMQYPGLKDNPNFGRYSDFTPFKDTYDVPWEGVIFEVINPLSLIIVGLLVMKMSDKTTRDWGLFGVFFVFLSSTAYLIAYNAETGTDEVWSLGGTLWVLGLVVVAIPVLITASGHLKQFVDAETKNNS